MRRSLLRFPLLFPLALGSCLTPQDLGTRPAPSRSDAPAPTDDALVSPMPNPAELCPGSECVAKVVVEEPSTVTIYHVASDASRLYYSTFGGEPTTWGVKWIPKKGGAPTSVLAADESQRGTIQAMVGGHDGVFVASLNDRRPAAAATTEGCDECDEAESLFRKVSPSASLPITVADGRVGVVSSMAVDATHLYWWSYDPKTFAALGIRRIPLEGGRPELVVSDANLSTTGLLAVDDGYLYYASREVKRVPKGGGVPQMLYSLPGGTAVASIALANEIFYWTESGRLYAWSEALSRGSNGPAVIGGFSGAMESGLAADPRGDVIWESWEQNVSSTDGVVKVKKWSPSTNAFSDLGEGPRDERGRLPYAKRIAADAESVFFSLNQNIVYQIPNGPPALH